MAESIREQLSEIKEWKDNIEKNMNAPKRSVFDKFRGTKSVKKEFKLPSQARIGKKSKIKKNYALLFYIRTNGYVDIKLAPIVNDLIYVPETGQYHAATAEYLLRHKEYPVLIQPEYRLTSPFSMREDYKEASKTGDLAAPQRVIIQAMKQSQLKPPSAMGGKNLLWIMVAVIVILYLVSQMFGAKV